MTKIKSKGDFPAAGNSQRQREKKRKQGLEDAAGTSGCPLSQQTEESRSQNPRPEWGLELRDFTQQSL